MGHRGECALAAKNLAAEKLPGKSKVADAAAPQGRNRGLRDRVPARRRAGRRTESRAMAW
jgi:hypothetical protein